MDKNLRDLAFYSAGVLLLFTFLGVIADFIMRTAVKPVMAVSQADPNGSIIAGQMSNIDYALTGVIIGFIFVSIGVGVTLYRRYK